MIFVLAQVVLSYSFAFVAHYYCGNRAAATAYFLAAGGWLVAMLLIHEGKRR